MQSVRELFNHIGACVEAITGRRTRLILLPLVLMGVGCNVTKPQTPHAPASESVHALPPERSQSLAQLPAAQPDIGIANSDKVKQLLETSKGKIVVVNVWATYCIPCIEEMPELAQFYRESNTQRVEFFSFSADGTYAIEDAVKPFVAEKSLPFRVYVLDELPPDELVKVLGASASGWDGELPATFVLDSSGSLKKSWLERVHLKDLTSAVAALSRP